MLASLLALAAFWACLGSGGRQDVPETPEPPDPASLGPEAATLYGEFEDESDFKKALKERPEMAAWDERRVFDDLSGATLQAKTKGAKLGERQVWVDGKLAAYSDGFGQYWLKLSPGPHVIVGRCPGYREGRQEMELKPGEIRYLNIYLKKR